MLPSNAINTKTFTGVSNTMYNTATYKAVYYLASDV